MIFGIGNDIVEIARIEKAMQNSERFAKRILTDFEYLEMQQSKHAHRYLAKKFASKEAIVKAFGSGIGNGIGWQMMQIEHDDAGRPIVKLFSTLEARFQAQGITHCHLSISDEQFYSMAMVVLEKS